MSNISKADEQKWLERYGSGDETAREEMILAYKPMAEHLVDKIISNNNRLSEMKSDFKQSALEELVKAFNTYNPKKGCMFSTYAHKLIRTRIYKEIEKENYYINRQDNFTDDILSYIEFGDSELTINDIFNVVNRIKHLLTKRELDYVIFVLLQGKTNMSEIGRKFGISRERVRQIRCKLRSKIELKTILLELVA